MKEVPHHVDLGKNILCLGQDTLGGQFKHQLVSFLRGTGRQEWQALACNAATHRDSSAKRGYPHLPETAESMVAECCNLERDI